MGRSMRGGSLGCGWGEQAELEAVDEERQFGFWIVIAGEQNLASVGVWKMNVDHLDGSEFFERAARGQPRRQRMKATGQGDLHAVWQDGDEDVGLDALLVLMEDRTDRQIAFEIAERLFDGDELGVVLP